MDNAILTQIAKDNFPEFRFVEARFTEHRDLKITWKRASDKSFIELSISDYLRNAPVTVVDAVFKKIAGHFKGEEGARYPDFVCDYFESEGFRMEGLNCNQVLRMERMKEVLPDLDYDTESETNSRVHDMLMALEEKGLKVAPVVVGITSDTCADSPWITSLLFKEIILQKDFVDVLEDEELGAVLEALLDVIHTDFKEVAGEPCPDIRQMIFNNLIDEDAMEELYKKLERFKE